MARPAAAVAILLAAGCGGGAPELTATPSLPAGPPLGVEPVVTGLSQPVQALAAPGDPHRLYVVEQRGLVRIVEHGERRPRRAPFLDLRSETKADGERGLFAIAFHPEWPERRVVYASYTNRAGDSRVTELVLRGGRVVSRRHVLAVDQPYENHNGGFIAFGPDRRLYLGLGDGGDAFDPEQRSQDPAQPHGKLLRLDVSGGAREWETVALGLRNPWRFSFDAETGDLWIGDVGQDRWEEVNVLRAGAKGAPNFGWDVYEGRDRVEEHEATAGTSLVWPVAVYGHDVGCSISGGHVHRGPDAPSLRGRYVYGDWCSGRLWSVATDGTSVRAETPRIPTLTSFGADGRGRLLAVAGSGTIYRFDAGRT
ncbi:MAG TPA: PQQ-dependent sugar dehydrogenase [Gaiellaceae bacterium]|nr:PQQ-dependent sugar dehydrogenase [Gaiellaceae bacterium]